MKNSNGFILPWVISIMLLVGFMVSAAMSVIYLNLGNAVRNNSSQLALNISEAGVNYYLWHLSHYTGDFKDGNASASQITSGQYSGYYGPFVHTYRDDNSNIVGSYTLYIKQKSIGSTVAIVKSIGKTADGRSVRSSQSELGAPSFASYGLSTGSEIWFGSTETADGPVHSNVGVHMDGVNNSDVTSANGSYIPSATYGGNGTTSRNAVWCNAGTNCSTRTTTNNNGTWRYPVPTIDFAKVTADRCTLKLTAFKDFAATTNYANGTNPCNNTPDITTDAYIPRYSSTGSFSSEKGYLIELNNNNTYNVRKVDNQNACNRPYTSALALSTTYVKTNIAIPPSGIIFVEDNVWIRSNSVFHGRVTIVAARQDANDSNKANIVAAGNIEYSTKNGQDSLGLISEDSFIVPDFAAPATTSSTGWPFKIHAAIIADSSVYVPSSYDGCSTDSYTTSTKNMEFYGSIAMKSGTWTWSYTNGVGFKYNTTSYDYNLLYAPPPAFPITSTYDILNWREILVTP